MKNDFKFSVENEEHTSSCSRQGRPSKDFDDCEKRTKRRKIRKIQESYSQSLINASATPSYGEKQFSPFSNDFALSLFIQAKLSKCQYEIIRTAFKNAGHNLLPSYKRITAAKKNCYPENIKITDTSAEVPLQSLLDNTAKRILKTKNDDELDKLNGKELILTSKWGFDGASGQSQYSQRYSTEDVDASDSNLFMTSIVPMCLINNDINNTSVWKNTLPSSTRYCRALRFRFEKETIEF